MTNKCLIIVDLQNDFCEGGVYAVPNSLSIILNISNTIHHFKNVIFTKRCYNTNDPYFKGNIKKHCIDNTSGSDINCGLIKCDNFIQIKRPYNKSIFCDDVFKKNHKIINILKEKKITDIYFCGLDFVAIYNSIIDAYKYGYKCHLIQNCMVSDIGKETQMLFLNYLGVNVLENMVED